MLAFGFRDSSTALGVALPLIAALAALSCGCKVFESTIADPAVLSLTIAPDPATAQASDDPGYAWLATFTGTLSETAGVAVTINSVNTTLRETSDGTVVTGGEDPLVKIDVATSATRVEANGSIAIDFVVHYTLAGGGREAVVDVVVLVTDDYRRPQNVAVRATLQ